MHLIFSLFGACALRECDMDPSSHHDQTLLSSLSRMISATHSIDNCSKWIVPRDLGARLARQNVMEGQMDHPQ
ncbi:hypothetical protein BDV10DRAFT_66477 [Aspergillus recurvatus]